MNEFLMIMLFLACNWAGFEAITREAYRYKRWAHLYELREVL